jgi:hypothetical protein
MLTNTESTINQPKLQREFHGQLYKEDPFTIVDGHYVDLPPAFVHVRIRQLSAAPSRV